MQVSYISNSKGARWLPNTGSNDMRKDLNSESTMAWPETEKRSVELTKMIHVSRLSLAPVTAKNARCLRSVHKSNVSEINLAVKQKDCNPSTIFEYKLGNAERVHERLLITVNLGSTCAMNFKKPARSMSESGRPSSITRSSTIDFSNSVWRGWLLGNTAVFDALECSFFCIFSASVIFLGPWELSDCDCCCHRSYWVL